MIRNAHLDAISSRKGLKLIFLIWVFLSGCEPSNQISVFFEDLGGNRSPQINCEVANSPGERARGLMYRKEMGEQDGMLFVFPDQTSRGFWMKNTYLELDIIFINSEREVVNVVSKAVPLSEEKRASTGPAKYVLEIKGGLAEKWGIKPKSRIVFNGLPPMGS